MIGSGGDEIVDFRSINFNILLLLINRDVVELLERGRVGIHEENGMYGTKYNKQARK
jgi:hypothetical protein